MTTHIHVAMQDCNNMRCSQQSLLDDILSGKIQPLKVEYTVYYINTWGCPCVGRDAAGVNNLAEDLKCYPDDEALIEKRIDIWVTQ